MRADSPLWSPAFNRAVFSYDEVIADARPAVIQMPTVNLRGRPIAFGTGVMNDNQRGGVAFVERAEFKMRFFNVNQLYHPTDNGR